MGEMKREMIWATEAGVSLHIAKSDRSATFRIDKGEDAIATAEIEDWKFLRIVQLLGGKPDEQITVLEQDRDHYKREFERAAEIIGRDRLALMAKGEEIKRLEGHIGRLLGPCENCPSPELIEAEQDGGAQDEP